jgi:hypothetical protein
MTAHGPHDPGHGDKHSEKQAVHLALVDRLRRQAADVRRLTSGIPEDKLAAPTVPGKWSLKELACHFRRMEEIFAERFHRMLTEDNALIVPYNNPDADPRFVELTKAPTEQIVADYLRERETFCRRLEALSPADWHRKARHPEFEHFDVHFMIEYMAHHEAHHVYQLFQRRVPLGKLPH